MNQENKKKSVVFVFEDEFHIRESIVHFFLSEGYEVKDAESYSKAIDILSNLSINDDINLAILDIKQEAGRQNLPSDVAPEEVGFHLADAIRQLDKTVPIIFLTAFEEMKEDSKKYHPFKFFAKGSGSPIKDPEIFKKTVREAINAQDNHRGYGVLPKGKICIKHNKGTQSINFILNLHDILCFETTDGSYTEITVRQNFRKYTLTMSAIDFKRKLSKVMEIHEIEDCFKEVYRGKYANLEHLVAYDENSIYFDYDCKQKLQINTETFQTLKNQFPYFKTT